MSELLVYSASAGSGKTHSIAGQYIMLLFLKSQAHRNILAVTFTNKACEEMKSRIVEDMYKISSQKDSDRINEIHSFTALPKDEILRESKKIFKNILHDYSFFSVSTIDSFFQKIVRNFTRETGIQYNYEIELDKDLVISKAVDDLISLCETDTDLREDIIALVQQNIDNSTKWDFRYNLKSFLKTVLESDYRSYEKEYNKFFADKKKVDKFVKELNDLENEFESEICKLCGSMQDLLDKNGLTISDFSGGTSRSVIKRILSIYEKIQEAPLEIEKIFSDIDVIEKWLKKADIGKEPLSTVTYQLMQISERIKDFYISHNKTYYTCNLIKKQINYAALIDKSLQIVHKNLFDSGKFLISEVPVFLSEIATQNSSSFIFEKTGSFYENYLIDEFQDTSRIQWDSFKPLLSESLSAGSPEQINSIVGDLKQSIYSWRGGDWRLLAIDVKNEFEKFYKEIALQNNWRSGKEIVSFNNNFFGIASGVLKDVINANIPSEYHANTGDLIQSTIYSNISQNVKKDFSSAVKIDIFKSKEDGESDIIKNLISQIEDLQQKNYQPGEIMILVRTNKDGSRIAEEIIKHAQSDDAKPGVVYDVISSEALLISSNKSIKLLISCFKYLSENNDDLAFYEAAYSYYVHKNIKNNEKIVFSKEEFAQFLNNALSTIKQTFNHRLLHETCDSLIKILELNHDEENIPFLNSFRDLLHEYSLNNPAEVTKFLEYWEEKGKNQNLRIPEKQNAINIITIHKSKGLAADFVFIPFLNWELKRSGNTIWVSSEIEPFNILPIWPTKADKFLESSIFEKDFHETNFKLSIEAFNMLYVAFTRARKGLFASSTIALCEKKDTISSIVHNSLSRLSIDNPLFFNIEEDENRISYNLGKIPKTDSNYTPPDYIKSYKIFVPEKKITIRPFYEKESHETKSDSNIIEGIKMHKIYENIKHYNDLDKSLLKLNSLGIISFDDIDIYKMRIKETLNHEFIKPWFDGTYTIYNEAEIASSKGEIRRPDRIMQKDDEIIIVDYKFGDFEKSQYINQTKYYAQLLSELGHKNIKTYIWFVMHDYLLEVNTSDNQTKKIILNK